MSAEQVPKPITIDGLEVKVVRSPRRVKTVQARADASGITIRIPARMSAREEREIVASMVDKVRQKRTSTRPSDAELRRRALELNRDVLGGRATPTSVRWVGNQTTRWGSCTPSTGEIRISDRLKAAPDYVVDAVLVHELTHTFISGHTREFYEWADRVPKAERARGYLEAMEGFSGQTSGSG